MDNLLPAIYNVVESIHFVIPLLAIFVCVVIFACSNFTSKSGSEVGQPPKEYLEQYKNIVSSKKPSKLSQQKPSATAKTKRQVSSNDKQREQNALSTSPKSGKSVQEGAKAGNNNPTVDKKVEPSSSKSKKEKQRQDIGHKSDDEWVTVVSGKNKKQPVTTVASTSSNNVSAITQKKVKEQPKEEFMRSISAENFEDYVGTVNDHRDEIDLGGKDSRYKKQANNSKRKNSEKNSAEISNSTPSPIIAATTSTVSDQFTEVQSARKRKNIRREN